MTLWSSNKTIKLDYGHIKTSRINKKGTKKLSFQSHRRNFFSEAEKRILLFWSTQVSLHLPFLKNKIQIKQIKGKEK